MKSTRTVMLLAALGLIPAAQVFAQAGAFVADPSALDTLSGASTGSVGGPGFDPIARAQGAAGSANAAADPFGAPAADPFGAPAGGADPFGAPAGGDPFGGGAAANPFGAPAGGDPFGGGAAPNPFGAPANSPFGGPAAGPGGFGVQVPTLSAWGGERIICHRTGQVLQDAREINILVSASGGYYDDGKSGNDAKADDNIYTNITVNDSYISPEAGLVKAKLIQTLEYASQLDPMAFTQVRVATTEPISPLPKLSELETQQDAALREWATRFLRDFRKNPEEFAGEFYPVYLPPPPRAPNLPLPVSFTPNAEQAVGPDGQPLPGGGIGAQFDAGAPGVTGDPVNPAASSRYF